MARKEPPAVRLTFVLKVVFWASLAASVAYSIALLHAAANYGS